MSRVKSNVNIFMRLLYTDVHKCASDRPRTIGTCHLIHNLIANCARQKKNLYRIDVRLFCKRFRRTTDHDCRNLHENAIHAPQTLPTQ